MPPKRAAASATRSRMDQVATNGVGGANGVAIAPPLSKKPAARGGRKRKVDEEKEEEEEVPNPSKKTKSTAKPKKPISTKVPPKPDQKVTNNKVPEQVLDIFVFGEGSSGELGLGAKKYDGKKPIDVKRPRINHNLCSKGLGVVQMACGGMHAVALTRDNRIYTWGVNDDGALGRDTTWDGGTRDVDQEDSDDDDDDDTGLNPIESTPTQVGLMDIKPGDRFSQVAATDSASFALTTDGRIYGWGTFRGSDGIIGFTPTIRIQARPMEIPGLKNITKLACGSNHVVALDLMGRVYTWGSGGQFQLGRKATTRHDGPKAGLRPECCSKFSAKKYAVDIGAGSYHSFFIDNHKEVWGWGLNNYSQTGHNDDSGQDDAMVLMPRVIESLSGLKIAQIVGGEHHTVARTENGELLTWGRVDGHQVGHTADKYIDGENAVFDENKRPRILMEPTRIDGKSTTLVTPRNRDSKSEKKTLLTQFVGIQATFVAAGTDTSFVIDDAGKVYSWGFSANYQTGQGTGDDIEVPTLIDNSAVKTRKLIWAGAGGQYSVLAAAPGGAATNGCA